MESPLLAYVIESEDDGATVAFGRNPMEARRLGAQELNNEYEGVTCKRAPEMDSYAAAGKVPVQDMIEKFGWIYDCWQCSAKVDGDTETYDDDTDEWKEQNPVYDRDMVFCSPECKQAWDAERARLAQIREELQSTVLARYPGITIKTVGENNLPPMVLFLFPGGKYEVKWILGEDNVWCCQPDVDAWHTYKASLESREATV